MEFFPINEYICALYYKAPTCKIIKMTKNLETIKQVKNCQRFIDWSEIEVACKKTTKGGLK